MTEPTISPAEHEAGGDSLGETASGLPPRAAAVLAYSAWWVSGALFLLTEPENAFVRFHARQAVIGLGGLWLAGLCLWVFSFVAVFVSVPLFRASLVMAELAWGAGVVLWLVCLLQAWRGRWWACPGFARKLKS